MDEKKVREAISRLKDHFRIHDDGRPTPKLDAACKIAYECMEKQLSKKPIEHSTKFAPMYECPSCGDIDVYGQKNCDNCGQRLDWRE